MVKGYYQALTKELHELGYRYVVNAKGSHEKWMKGDHILIVPRHLDTRHLANKLLQMAGSTKKF